MRRGRRARARRDAAGLAPTRRVDVPRRARGRRRDRGRQAGRARGAPRRRPPGGHARQRAAGPLSPRSPASATRPARASSTASTRARPGCWWSARTPAAYDALVAAARGPRRSSGATWRSCGARPRPPHGHRSTRRSGGRRATRRGWRCRPTGREARTRYEVVERVRRARRGRRCSTCRLETGRTHQIRVHLAAIGHPVVGDDALRRRAPVARRCRARSCTPPSLAFDHPVTGERVDVRRRRCPPTSRRRRCADLDAERASGERRRRVGVGPGARRRGPSAAMSASVKPSRWRRMCSPTSAQTASSTHWPSWSQAPSWWGSPKSPSDDRAVDRATRSRDSVISSGGAGEHVAAADAPLRAHQPGALEREQDLLEVGLGEAGALGDVAHRGRARLVGVQREREQRPAGVVAPGRDLHGDHRTGVGRALDGGLRRAGRRGATGPQWTDVAVAGTGPPRLRRRRASATSCPRCSDRPRRRAAGVAARRRRRAPTRSCCSCSTASAGTSSQERRAPDARRWRRWTAGRSPRSPRPPPRPR